MHASYRQAAAVTCGVCIALLGGSALAAECPGQELQSWTYTAQGDFEQGAFINLNGEGDQLQINTWQEIQDAAGQGEPVLRYVWVACSDRGTVVRIDTLTRQVVGEYRTCPSLPPLSLPPGPQPSRTTVDFDTDVWVGNRTDVSYGVGHVVKIGAGNAYQWVDRDLPNHTAGQLDTSTGLGDVRDWPDDGDGLFTSADIASAHDELILLYRTVPAGGVRTVAVDRANNVWIGGFDDQSGSDDRYHGLIDGRTGITIRDFTDMGCGGYGGLVDRRGVLWSANREVHHLLCFDPADASTTCIPVDYSYGLAVDLDGTIWNTRERQNAVRKIDPLTWRQWEFDTHGTHSKGVAVTPADNHIWIANQYSHEVVRLDLEQA